MAHPITARATSSSAALTSASSVSGSIMPASTASSGRNSRCDQGGAVDDEAGRDALLQIVPLERAQPAGERHQRPHAIRREPALGRDHRDLLLRRQKAELDGDEALPRRWLQGLKKLW